MDEKPRIPGLQRRKSGRYYFRMKVPTELRVFFGGRHEIVKSLGTSDHAEARRIVAVERARTETKFAQVRRKLTGRSGRPVTNADIEQAVWDWFTEQDDKEWRAFESADADALEMARENRRTDEAYYADLTNEDAVRTIEHAADHLIERYGLALNREDTLFADLCAKIRRGQVEQIRRWQDWLAGDFSHRSHDPAFAAAPSRADAGLTLDLMIDEYLTDLGIGGRSPKKALEYRLAFSALREVVGPDEKVSTIQRSHCRQVRELLLRLPTNATKRFPGLALGQAADRAEALGLKTLSTTTTNSYLTKIGTLFRWAMREGHMAVNPAEGLQVAAETLRKSDLRQPFTNEQLTKIFSAPLYTGCSDDGLGYAVPGPNIIRGTRFWVPVIALYSGMRLNEICQLHVADVAKRDGVLCFIVDERTEDRANPKRLKSPSARRSIPVHDVLRRAGIDEFIVERQHAGTVRLFPELKLDKRGYYSDAFQKWFSRFLAKADATAPRTSFHSFRHNFRDAMREADIREEMARALGGWADANVSAIYGSGFRVRQLNEALQQVRYPGLELRHLNRSE